MVFTPLPKPPRAVVVLRLDTLGDLVLFGPALKRLRAAWPETRITVVIRTAYLELARRSVSGVEWLGTSIDPFRKGPSQVKSEAAALQSEILARAPDLILGATARRTWLEALLASSVPQARRLSLGDPAPDPFYSGQLEAVFGAKAEEAFPENIPSDVSLPDWKQNQRFAGLLLGSDEAPSFPELRLDEALLSQARDVLAKLGLAPGAYAVCAAAGHANVRIKTWPSDRYAVLTKHIASRHSIRTLLVGQESERGYLDGIAKAAREANPELWLGGNADLPLLAALVGQARFYYGNDTGAMHLAAAAGLPVLAVFGGGTWPRFRPATRKSVELVNPLPCFGCGWDCAFGDAPCIKSIQDSDACAAVDELLSSMDKAGNELRQPAKKELDQTELLQKARWRACEVSAELARRQNEFEKTIVLAAEKDGEIASLKQESDKRDREIATLRSACAERLELIEKLDTHIRTMLADRAKFEQEIARLRKELLDSLQKAAETETFYRRLSPEADKWAGQVSELERKATALEQKETARQTELERLQKTLGDREASIANLVAGLGTLELHNFYRRQLREKEDVLQELNRACQERERVLTQLAAESTKTTAALRRLRIASSAWWKFKISDPLNRRLEKKVLSGFWMQLGTLHQYAPRPLGWDRLPERGPSEEKNLPTIALVTPSYNQAAYLERTILSIAGQKYPKLLYVVQDGGSNDGSAAIIKRHAAKLRAWECVKDKGQADAIKRGFAKVEPALGPDDVMAWVNSDDLLAPGALAFVGRYFARHPEVDAVYGNRVVIDTQDREIGRWIMPRHDPETLRWFDFVPQETLFWRKRIWEKTGGVDPSFHFALDWDLLLRFQENGARIERLPYLLGAFRVHDDSKTTVLLSSRGKEEMERVRRKVHGAVFDPARMDLEMRRAQYRGALAARLLALGIRR